MGAKSGEKLKMEHRQRRYGAAVWNDALGDLVSRSDMDAGCDGVGVATKAGCRRLRRSVWLGGSAGCGWYGAWGESVVVVSQRRRGSPVTDG